MVRQLVGGGKVHWFGRQRVRLEGMKSHVKIQATLPCGWADGMTPDEVIAAYPQLTVVTIQAALAYAADVMRQELLVPFTG